MPIQFRCTNCGQPIEVDDEHAGSQAACPYCRSVGTVPTSSTYQPEPVAAASAGDADAGPVGTSPPSQPPDLLHVSAELSPRQRAARIYGNYALICLGLAVLLFAGIAMQALLVMAETLESTAATQPATPGQLAAAHSQAVEQAVEKIHHKPWFVALSCGSQFLAVAGLALAIASLARWRRGNWRGLIALLACGMYVLCICGGIAIQLATGGLAPPG